MNFETGMFSLTQKLCCRITKIQRNLNYFGIAKKFEIYYTKTGKDLESQWSET